MTNRLAEIERKVIDAISEHGSEDLTVLKNALFDRTGNPHLLSEDAAKGLVDRYARTEFTVLGWINHLEEKEIRHGNYSVMLSPLNLEPNIQPVKISDVKDFVTSKDHILFPQNLEHFLRQLQRKKLIISFPQEKGFLFRSKTAELIRLILELPVRKWDRKDKKQYWFDSALLNHIFFGLSAWILEKKCR